MSTCNRLNLQTLESKPVMPKISLITVSDPCNCWSTLQARSRVHNVSMTRVSSNLRMGEHNVASAQGLSQR